MNIWHSNPACGVFPSQEEKQFAGGQGTKKKGFADVFVVVTENVFLLLEPDHKIKNVARLVAWATLPSLE
jgi:hypothetical protein